MNFKKNNKITSPIISFFKNESASGIILMICAVIALIVANSGIASSYDKFLHSYITIGYKDFSLSMSILHWINDGLMAKIGRASRRERVS